jgi:uncharacterized membrane protein YbhN (UPF0104 family)
VGESCINHAFRVARSLSGRHAALLWALLIVGGLAIFAHRQQHEIGALGGALADAGRGWLLALIALQAIAIAFTVLTYRTILGRLGHHLGHLLLTRVHLQRHVVGVLTPVGGPASAYVFVRSLSGRQVSASDSLLTLGLRGVTGYAAFVTLLVPAMVVSHPSSLVLGAAGALALLLVVMLAATVALLRGRDDEGALPGWLPDRVAAFFSGARAHHLGPRDLVAPYLLALGLNLTGVATLFISLRGLGQDVSPATALAAFAVGNLFAIIAPVFQGAGAVEASMAVTLQGFGVPGAMALGATLLYRLADIWIPLGVGLLVQASQHPYLQRSGLRLGELVAGFAVVAIGWFVVPGEAQLPFALLAASAGALGLVLALAPMRGRPAFQFATAGVAVGAVPAILVSELDHLALMSVHLSMLPALLFS